MPTKNGHVQRRLLQCQLFATVPKNKCAMLCMLTTIRRTGIKMPLFIKSSVNTSIQFIRTFFHRLHHTCCSALRHSYMQKSAWLTQLAKAPTLRLRCSDIDAQVNLVCIRFADSAACIHQVLKTMNIFLAEFPC